MREMVLDQSYILAQKRKFEAYDYYGIPYGIFDGNDDNSIEQSKREKDIEDARILIMEGKSLPKDLELRLLAYKENNKN